MTTWFVSRHPGAVEWMRLHGPAFDQHVPHLAPDLVHPGDRVIGTLPVHLAAAVCARGAEYWHLALTLPAQARGRELNVDELNALGATLQRYEVIRQPNHS